jgi:deoxyribodipyrimidine photo-lyase
MANSFKLSLPQDRQERLQYIRRMFPQAKGRNLTADWAGGRVYALDKLADVDAVTYAKNRNFINGSVSKLSPYIRHGCITVKEIAASVTERFGEQAEKYIEELTYYEFWRENWYRHGNRIFSDMEAPKVPLGDNPIPAFVKQGFTGLPCMDEVIRDLNNDGYVHNHARMWFAAFMVHWLKVDWRQAADWFESQLLDGNLASNHLSWQWVASTFSNKPYYFNKENIARFTGEKFCATCQMRCPFDDTYENLQQQLFPDSLSIKGAQTYPIQEMPKLKLSSHTAVSVLVHDEMLSPRNPLMRLALPKLFVFDDVLYQDWPLKRIQFMADCLSEMPDVQVWIGDTRTVLQELNIGQVFSQNTPNMQIKSMLAAFNPIWQEEEHFVNVDVSLQRLERFSRYWEKVQPEIVKKA